MAILNDQASGVPWSSTRYNANMVNIEAALLDIGPFIISGLVPSIGTGLSVNVTSGVASIGGQVSVSSFSIGGLSPSTTNHLYLLNTGAATSNTSGTQPANSVKLGTAATGVATVTSVDTSAASGRQDKNTFSAATVTTLTATTLNVTTINSSGNTKLTKTPDATTQYGVLSIGDGGFTGGAGHYSGGAGGSLIAVNLVSGGTADLLNLQINGVSKWKLGSGGNVTYGEGSNIVFGTSTGTQLGTSSSQKLALWGGTPVVRPASNAELRQSLIDIGAITGGTNSLNLNGGDLTANQAILSGGLQGSNTALQLKRLSYTFPSDANQTLSASDKSNVIIDIQTGVISAQRDLLVSGNAGAFYIIINREAFGVNVRVGANTGIVVASHRARIICWPGGTNAFALTPDVDYTV